MRRFAASISGNHPKVPQGGLDDGFLLGRDARRAPSGSGPLTPPLMTMPCFRLTWVTWFEKTFRPYSCQTHAQISSYVALKAVLAKQIALHRISYQRGYLPMDIQGTNLFFLLIARRYEKTSTVFTSNKTFSQ